VDSLLRGTNIELPDSGCGCCCCYGCGFWWNINDRFCLVAALSLITSFSSVKELRYYIVYEKSNSFLARV